MVLAPLDGNIGGSQGPLPSIQSLFPSFSAANAFPTPQVPAFPGVLRNGVPPIGPTPPGSPAPQDPATASNNAVSNSNVAPTQAAPIQSGHAAGGTPAPASPSSHGDLYASCLTYAEDKLLRNYLSYYPEEFPGQLQNVIGREVKLPRPMVDASVFQTFCNEIRQKIEAGTPINDLVTTIDEMIQEVTYETLLHTTDILNAIGRHCPNASADFKERLFWSVFDRYDEILERSSDDDDLADYYDSLVREQAMEIPGSPTGMPPFG
ncbi:MAG: hypothetical protein ACR652_22725 [Methylocystis sp.]|uniref:hypothetical protein n=1 Tax=Methylocystis sp. TaxID=1911079 RepID=UPI003DA5D639